MIRSFALVLAIFISSQALSDVSIHKVVIPDVTYDEVTFVGQKFLKPSLQGLKNLSGVTAEIGAPALPTVTFKVLAHDKKDIAVTYKQVNKKAHKRLAHRLAPLMESNTKMSENSVKFFLDETKYQKSSLLDPKFEIAEAGTVNGVKQFRVILKPLAYDPVMGRISKVDEFEVAVTDEIKSAKRTGPENIVFIVGEKFAHSKSLEKYIKFKRSLGFETNVLVVKPAHSSDAIRDRLRRLYKEKNLVSGLIIGDAADVQPGHPTALNHGMATDHPYRCLDVHEYKGDIDSPDITLGRVSVENESDLQRILKRFTNYQLGNFETLEWFKHPSFLATDDVWDIAEATHDNVIKDHFAPNGYTGFFPEANQAGGDQFYAIRHKATGRDALRAINDGRIIVQYSGHGLEEAWDAPKVTAKNVREIQDNGAVPFVVSNACITGQFIYPESFGETWLRARNGAIAFFGSMDYSYWQEDQVLEEAMYYGLFKKGYRTFGEMTSYALGRVYDYYAGKNLSRYYWETYVTLGDPTIEFRLNAPENITVKYPEVILDSMNSYDVQVTDSKGLPVKGIKVSLTNKNFVSAKTTDDEGKVTLDLGRYNAGDALDLTVYGGDYKTFTKELVASSTVDPIFGVENISLSNNLNYVRPGEFFKLNFDIVNLADNDSTGGMVSVSDFSDGIKIVNASTYVGYVKSGEKKFVDDLSFVALESIDSDEPQFITVMTRTNEGVIHEQKIEITINKMMLAVEKIKFANGEGLAPGETGDVFLTIKNNGDLDIDSIVLMDAGASNVVLNGETAIGNLKARESKEFGPFSITLNDDVALESNSTMIAMGEFNNGIGNETVLLKAIFNAGRIKTSEYRSGEINFAILDRETVSYNFELPRNLNAIKNLSLEVVIDHNYVGDLTIALVHPDGDKIVLRERTGGRESGIHDVYKTTELRNFLGLKTQGIWSLEITDATRSDAGTLKEVNFTVSGL